jgi:diadenosine tetraphosphate (Ap4A) HIT family hydrolase
LITPVSKQDCIFCQIIAHEKPASIVYEDEESLVFMDLYPLTPGHMLVIPKRHVSSLLDLPADEAAQIFLVGQKMDAALRVSGLRCEGVNLVLSDGKAAGQEVWHVHLHVFPRFMGDGVHWSLDPALRTTPDRAQLNTEAQKIRTAIAQLTD